MFFIEINRNGKKEENLQAWKGVWVWVWVCMGVWVWVWAWKGVWVWVMVCMVVRVWGLRVMGKILHSFYVAVLCSNQPSFKQVEFRAKEVSRNDNTTMIMTTNVTTPATPTPPTSMMTLTTTATTKTMMTTTSTTTTTTTMTSKKYFSTKKLDEKILSCRWTQKKTFTSWFWFPLFLSI